MKPTTRKSQSRFLNWLGQLKSADVSVNADAVRNEVTLSGTVRTRAAREKAIELAKSAKPGVAVNDKIDVKPGV
jgi:osmotically-inducible protein OsmY